MTFHVWKTTLTQDDARGPHLQHNERVQLQRLILQRQGAVEGHYNVHPGLSPITTWYKVQCAESSLQRRRRLFSINLKLIHSTQAYYPVLSVKKARRSTPAETSKKP